MKFGIENYSLTYPLSAIASIFLILGFYRIGKILFKHRYIRNSLQEICILNFQYIPISLIFIYLIFYPLVLFFNIHSDIFYFTSILILLIGIWHFIDKIKNLKLNNINLFKNLYSLTLFIFVLLYFFLSLGPITDADSLDYHISVPLHIINYGTFPKDISWFHASQAGIGEIPIILGLIIGAEQFSALVQFSGFISILGVIKKNINTNNNIKNFKNEFYLILIFLSIPLLIFLNSTAKPQLIFISYSTLAFAITFFNLKIEKSNSNLYKFFLIILLLYVGFEGKFSFILSAFIISIISSFKILKGKNYKAFIFTFLIILILSFPSFYWKYLNYGGNFINKIYFPFFPVLDGYKALYNSINACEFPCNKSFFLFPNSLGRYTETIGIAILTIPILLFTNIKKNILIIFSIIFYFLILYNYGKFSARFIIEPVIWSIITLKHSKFNFDFKFSGLLKLYIFLQGFLTASAILVGIFTISVGFLTPKLKSYVLTNYAYGYDLANWSSSSLKTNKKVIYSHRSISLPKMNIIPTDFLLYTTDKKYLNLLKEKKPEYLIIHSNSSENIKKLISCTSGIYKKKENYFKQKSRNFFNKRDFKYSAYIYYFDYNKLPDCYFK